MPAFIEMGEYRNFPQTSNDEDEYILKVFPGRFENTKELAAFLRVLANDLESEGITPQLITNSDELIIAEIK